MRRHVQQHAWITDRSLKERIVYAVTLMIEGKHSYKDRMKLVMRRLRHLSVHDFPDDLQKDWQTIVAADALALVEHPPAPPVQNFGLLKSAVRAAWAGALLRIYTRLIQEECGNL